LLSNQESVRVTRR